MLFPLGNKWDGTGVRGTAELESQVRLRQPPLSPFSPGAAAIEAGRIMLDRIEELSAQGHAFAFETTLSGRS